MWEVGQILNLKSSLSFSKEVIMQRILFLVVVWLATAFPAESAPARSRYQPSESDPADSRSLVIDNDVIAFEYRHFQIPFQIQPDLKPNMRAIHLFVSEDQGKTWTLVEKRDPTEDHFIYRTTRDGLL